MVQIKIGNCNEKWRQDLPLHNTLLAYTYVVELVKYKKKKTMKMPIICLSFTCCLLHVRTFSWSTKTEISYIYITWHIDELYLMKHDLGPSTKNQIHNDSRLKLKWQPIVLLRSLRSFAVYFVNTIKCRLFGTTFTPYTIFCQIYMVEMALRNATECSGDFSWTLIVRLHHISVG